MTGSHSSLTEHKADRPPAEARQHTHPIFLQYTPHPHAGHSPRVTDCYHRQRESSLKPKDTHTGCTLSVCCIHSHTCYCRQRQPSSKQKTHLACLPHKPFHTRSQSTETGSHGLLTRQYNSVVQHTLYHARLQSLFGHAETLVESKRYNTLCTMHACSHCLVMQRPLSKANVTTHSVPCTPAVTVWSCRDPRRKQTLQHTLYHARLQSLFGHAETLVESKRHKSIHLVA